MLNQQTLEQLRTLKLTGMLDALEQQQAQPQTHDLSFDERLALLVEREVVHRENRRLSRLLKAAKLRVQACVEDIDYRHPRGLEKSHFDICGIHLSNQMKAYGTWNGTKQKTKRCTAFR
jgi:DNA replication protein DnaC